MPVPHPGVGPRRVGEKQRGPIDLNSGWNYWFISSGQIGLIWSEPAKCIRGHRSRKLKAHHSFLRQLTEARHHQHRPLYRLASLPDAHCWGNPRAPEGPADMKPKHISAGHVCIPCKGSPSSVLPCPCLALRALASTPACTFFPFYKCALSWSQNQYCHHSTGLYSKLQNANSYFGVVSDSSRKHSKTIRRVCHYMQLFLP